VSRAREAGEVLAPLAFYAGWPNVFSGLPVMKDVLDKCAGGATGARPR
jgi:4-carboxymuconolactone decarboxylase